MLAKYYRFHAYNATDKALVYGTSPLCNILVRLQPWKVVSGSIVYGTVITDTCGFGTGETLNTSTSTEGTVVDNSSNIFAGAKGYFEVNANDAATEGVVYLLMEETDADGTNWPSDKTNFDPLVDLKMVCALSFADDTNRAKNFDLE